MTSASPQPRRVSPPRRIVSGSAALLVLLLVLGGVPWALVTVGGDPLPRQLTLRRIGAVLTGPDDGTVVIGVITTIAWIAWLIFVIATVSELITVASRHRIRIRLPGLGPWQRAAGSLLILTVSMIMAGSQGAFGAPEPDSDPDPTTPAVTMAHAAPTGKPRQPRQQPVGRQAAIPAATDASATDHDEAVTPTAAARSHHTKNLTHIVQRGDDLWSLAERYYGHGGQWRIISAANPGVLTGGPDRLEPGWQLRIPIRHDRRQVRVGTGDSLSAIADREYGDPAAWHMIFDANRDVIADPDRIAPGTLLSIPDRDGSSSKDGIHGRARPGGRAEHAPRGHSAHGSSSGGRSASGHRDKGSDTGGPRRGHGGHSAHDTGAHDTGAEGTGGTPKTTGTTSATPSVPNSAAPHAQQQETGSGRQMPGETARGQAQASAGWSVDSWEWFTGVTGVVGAGLIAAVAARRSLQLQDRPVGRRIPHPSEAARHLETRLGRGQSPGRLQLADLALRAVGAYARCTASDVPVVVGARLQSAEIELIMTEPGLPAPDGFTVTGDRWRLAADDLPAVCAGLALSDETGRSDPNALANMPHPCPALTPVGADPDGAELLLNLEHARIVSIRSGPKAQTSAASAPVGTPIDRSGSVYDRREPAESRSSADGVLAGMIASSAFTPWSLDTEVVVVGDDRWSAVIGQYNVGAVHDLDRLLDRWERRAEGQRARLKTCPGRTASWMRLDPDADDAWAPQIALIASTPSREQLVRLEALLEQQPAAALAAVVAGTDVNCAWQLRCESAPRQRRDACNQSRQPTRTDGADSEPAVTAKASDDADPANDADGGTAVLEPLGWRLRPQQLPGPTPELLQNLLAATASTEHTPAPWWAPEFPADAQPAHARSEPQIPATPGLQASGQPARARPSEQEQRSAARAVAAAPTGATDAPGWPSAAARVTGADETTADRHNDKPKPAPVSQRDDQQAPSRKESATGRSGRGELDQDDATPIRRQRISEEPDNVSNLFAPTEVRPSHPTVWLLGPTELIGGAGEPPPRAARQCIEYCAWLLEHPGRTAQQMATGLVVAEGTRRSNMSRLRTWLGSDEQGEPYLPDAYSGRITLSPLVSSDWHRLQLICASGVNRTSTGGLCRALQLVRGAPLADTAPGQWSWAEEMRTDMVSVVRDIGVELVDRALGESDIDLARWAAGRALTAAGPDEWLMAARVRTEHRAGNQQEVERLSLQMTAQSRALGLDLDPETVDLLQQTMEGGIRARA